MKVAFIGQKGIPSRDGGVERYVECLSTFLASSGQEIVVYNRNDYLPDKITEFREVKIVNLPYLKGKNVAAITHALASIFSAIRQKTDIIHFQGIGPSLLLWLPKILAPRIKLVATLHSFDYFNEKWSRPAKIMLQLGEKIMCRFSDEVIVLTESTRMYIKEKYGRDSVLIPNGTKIYENEATDKIMPWGLVKDGYILSVSRIIRLKGLQYLIAAYLKVKTDKKLVIVGDGPYLSELEKLAQDDPRIIFTGNQQGGVLDQLYANAYLFVQSSEMEGLSIALLEAMGHKTACLVSDIGANKEAIGESGFTFRSTDIPDLQNKLQDLLNKPESVSLKARESFDRAKKFFTWPEVARRVLDVYKK